MKKSALIIAAAAVILVAFAGCSSKTADPGTPPDDIVSSNSESANSEEPITISDVTAKIGLVSNTTYTVKMYENRAASTMLNYLSTSEMRFPTYNYNGDDGYVAQSIRGSYTRDDEVTVADVKSGELYLFSDGQLRLYFKDVAGANITATPVGKFEQDISEAVPTAYEENRGDTWNVDVYFLLTKNK